MRGRSARAKSERRSHAQRVLVCPPSRAASHGLFPHDLRALRGASVRAFVETRAPRLTFSALPPVASPGRCSSVKRFVLSTP